MAGAGGAASPRQQRFVRAYELIAAEHAAEDEDDPVASLQRLCIALTRELAVLGAAVNLMSDAGSHGVAAGSDQHSMDIDELQFSLGEGPCHDALGGRRPVLVADLAGVDGVRWPGYGPSAHAAGVAAVFAFPLHIGAAEFGVLDVYAARPGSLTSEQVSTALTFAEVATQMLHDAQLASPPGELDLSLRSALDYRSQIYQAQGIVMVALGISLAGALARMRAHAFANDQRLADLAAGIVDGRIHLERDDPSERE